MGTRVLTASDMARLIATVGPDEAMRRLITRLADAFAALDPIAIVAPPRAGFSYSDPGLGLLEWMPALRTGRHSAVKLVGYHPESPELRGLPTILSTIGLYDCATGALNAIADATLLTAMRTGAASAAASRVLARPDSAILGLIGTGAQAVTQAHALCLNFPIETILIYDVEESACSSFGRRIAALGLDVQVRMAMPEEILSEADILCTCTSCAPGAGPLFADGDMKRHLHINAVGADFPGKVELPLALLQRSFVVADFLEQALVEGECQQLSRAEITCDLSTLLAAPDRHAGVADRLTVFDSTGHAVEDLVSLEFALEAAEANGIGADMEIQALRGDPLNPYDLVHASAVTFPARAAIKAVAS